MTRVSRTLLAYALDFLVPNAHANPEHKPKPKPKSEQEWYLRLTAVAGDYTSDFHFVRTREADEWLFEIRSDDPYRDIDLYWEGVTLLDRQAVHNNGDKDRYRQKKQNKNKQKFAKKLYKKMVLEDFDLGVRVKAIRDGLVNQYSFNMDGKTVRRFRWILKGKKGESSDKDDAASFGESFGPNAVGANTIAAPVQRAIDPMRQIPQPGTGR